MIITSYPLGEMQANCYLLTIDSSCILIDPSDNATYLLEEIERKKLDMVGLFATHGHFDHVMAIGELQLSYQTRFGTELPFYIHSEDSFLLKRMLDTAKHFLSYEPIILPIQNISPLIAGELQIGPFQISILHTPGHTPGSCCLYFKNEKKLFTGDTIFADSIGRTDLSYSSKTQLYDSLKAMLSLPVETEVYPGHGESTTIEYLRSIIDLS